jgi:hypothetical protein
MMEKEKYGMIRDLHLLIKKLEELRYLVGENRKPDKKKNKGI